PTSPPNPLPRFSEFAPCGSGSRAQPPRDDTLGRFREAPLVLSIVRANVHGLDRTSTGPLRHKQYPGRVERARRLLPEQSHPNMHEAVSSTPRKSRPCNRPVSATSRWSRVQDVQMPTKE